MRLLNQILFSQMTLKSLKGKLIQKKIISEIPELIKIELDISAHNSELIDEGISTVVAIPGKIFL